jgi:hypothetical protein
MLIALPLMVLTFALASANAPQADEPPNPAASLACNMCHEDFQKAWKAGAHGQATNDPAFKEAWEAQGEPQECLNCHATGYDPATGHYEAEGITCQACHGKNADNHPMEPMPAERSAKLCGECHSETYFEWQASGHRAEGLDCQGCHDPHATDLKAANASETCATCHRARSSNFAHSAHSAQGLTCVDCHLAELPGDGQEGHARLDHSFNVSLSTCNECHAYQMHDPSQVHPENPTPMPPDAMAAVETAIVAEEPQEVNPLGFTTLTGLIGLAAGIILAPWLERWMRRRQ